MENSWKDRVDKSERMSEKVFEVPYYEEILLFEESLSSHVPSEILSSFFSSFDPPNPFNFSDSPFVSACASSKKEGTTKDSVLKDIQRRYMAYSFILNKSLDKVQFEVKTAKCDSLKEIPKRNDIVREKNAEIIRLQNEIKKLKEGITHLETNNCSSREELDAELKSLKEKLLLVENEKKACEEITSTLEKEIFDCLKTILDMQFEEERIKRLLAEAKLSLLKVENLFKKGERDAAMVEYESFKAKLKKQNPSAASPNQV